MKIMPIKSIFSRFAIITLLTYALAACKGSQNTTNAMPTPASPGTAVVLPTHSPVTTATSTALNLAHYAFPKTIDPSAHYLFYLHGKIIEDQGIPASSPDYGEYQYGAILEKLSEFGFIVISEQRPMNTDPLEYAKRVFNQVDTLLKAGTPAKNMTIVGASKGAGITIYISHLLENHEIN
jgi:hypothetical protein